MKLNKEKKGSSLGLGIGKIENNGNDLAPATDSESSVMSGSSDSIQPLVHMNASTTNTINKNQAIGSCAHNISNNSKRRSYDGELDMDMQSTEDCMLEGWQSLIDFDKSSPAADGDGDSSTNEVITWNPFDLNPSSSVPGFRDNARQAIYASTDILADSVPDFGGSAASSQFILGDQLNSDQMVDVGSIFQISSSHNQRSHHHNHDQYQHLQHHYSYSYQHQPPMTHLQYSSGSSSGPIEAKTVAPSASSFSFSLPTKSTLTAALKGNARDEPLLQPLIPPQQNQQDDAAKSRTIPLAADFNRDQRQHQEQLQQQQKLQQQQPQQQPQLQPQTAPAVVITTTCVNCAATQTPLWRRNGAGEPLCNACGLFWKLHGVDRPVSMKSDVVRKRNRGPKKDAAASSSSFAAIGIKVPLKPQPPNSSLSAKLNKFPLLSTSSSPNSFPFPSSVSFSSTPSGSSGGLPPPMTPHSGSEQQQHQPQSHSTRVINRSLSSTALSDNSSLLVKSRLRNGSFSGPFNCNNTTFGNNSSLPLYINSNIGVHNNSSIRRNASNSSGGSISNTFVCSSPISATATSGSFPLFPQQQQQLQQQQQRAEFRLGTSPVYGSPMSSSSLSSSLSSSSSHAVEIPRSSSFSLLSRHFQGSAPSSFQQQQQQLQLQMQLQHQQHLQQQILLQQQQHKSHPLFDISTSPVISPQAGEATPTFFSTSSVKPLKRVRRDSTSKDQLDSCYDAAPSLTPPVLSPVNYRTSSTLSSLSSSPSPSPLSATFVPQFQGCLSLSSTTSSSLSSSSPSLFPSSSLQLQALQQQQEQQQMAVLMMNVQPSNSCQDEMPSPAKQQQQQQQQQSALLSSSYESLSSPSVDGSTHLNEPPPAPTPTPPLPPPPPPSAEVMESLLKEYLKTQNRTVASLEERSQIFQNIHRMLGIDREDTDI